MANPDQFARRMGRLASGVVEGAAKAIRNSGISVVRSVVKATPKKTTKARSEWVANIGSPDLGERGIRSAAEVVSDARSALDEAAIRREISSGDVVEIHVANGGEKVPYLGVLNRGSSQQAPAGFVKTALEEGGRKTLGKARLLRGTRGSRAVGV